MKSKQFKKRKSKVMERLETMSRDEMAQRWREMRSRYVKFLSFFVIAMAALFLGNRYLGLSQGAHDIAGVAFNIFSVFAVLFLMLTVMSVIYGRPSATKQST
jgi:uncharacterized membrane protein YtjA (UPF0391 family)